jgi:DMSO/TMAO reductase YedYZ molybdopterin-dependent catalytic subunit
MRIFPLLVLAISAFAADPVLRIEGIAGHDGVVKAPLQISLADLQAMPRVTVRAKTHDGKEHGFEGVALAEVLHRAGLPQGEEVRGPLLSKYLLVTAHDGYRAIFSLPELDPAFTETHALLADRMDGEALTSREGPLRLVLPSEKRETRWVRMVEKIELLAAPDPVR